MKSRAKMNFAVHIALLLLIVTLAGGAASSKRVLRNGNEEEPNATVLVPKTNERDLWGYRYSHHINPSYTKHGNCQKSAVTELMAAKGHALSMTDIGLLNMYDPSGDLIDHLMDYIADSVNQGVDCIKHLASCDCTSEDNDECCCDVAILKYAFLAHIKTLAMYKGRDHLLFYEAMTYLDNDCFHIATKPPVPCPTPEPTPFQCRESPGNGKCADLALPCWEICNQGNDMEISALEEFGNFSCSVVLPSSPRPNEPSANYKCCNDNSAETKVCYDGVKNKHPGTRVCAQDCGNSDTCTGMCYYNETATSPKEIKFPPIQAPGSGFGRRECNELYQYCVENPPAP